MHTCSRKRFTRHLGLVLLACFGCLISAGFADAAGGSSIASAPAVVYGQQMFGNSATDGGANPARECAHQPQNGWWTLSVVAGDIVTIDWEAPPTQYLEVFPTRTTNFSLAQAHSFASSAISSNGHAQLRFTATVGGVMPMVIGTEACDTSGDPGPYSFTAYVMHAVRLSLPRLGRLYPRSLQVGVHAPDGTPISDPGLSVEVQLRWHGHWHTIGTATPTKGIATVGLHVPASLHGRRVAVRALAHGGAYVNTSTLSQWVLVV
jgi:hypothetical protein